eukprot:TRINITY_DN2386_c0_g1_i1.p1 TRINITY_DN2386_c0_g1~~TRINITY_DN2386_c0_g1_i1.p1  ORF type:complete len:178 (-),score=38.62 TRINITY_DN2386_c0_g1_i1:38-571(-)
MLSDFVIIFLTALFSSFSTEILSYIFFFNSDEYDSLVDTSKRMKFTVQKIEEKMMTVSAAERDRLEKKLEAAKEDLSTHDRSLNWIKMKSNFILSFFSIVIISILSSSFDGTAIGKLPFTPWGIVTAMSHRNLPGTDMTDLSYIFFYVLCMANIRGNLQKLLGTGGPKTTSMFTPPQ